MQINWRLFLNTTQKNKAEKLCNQFIQHLEGIEGISYTPYWKDDTLFEAIFTQKIPNITTYDELMLKVISNITILSGQWNIQLPEKKSFETSPFWGVCDKSIKFVGIKWASFDVIA